MFYFLHTFKEVASFFNLFRYITVRAAAASVAVIEEAVEGRAFRNDPANTVGAYLRGEFKKRGWKWPKHAYAWQQHFLTHHTTP